MSNPKITHVFNCYLPVTQEWLKLLLDASKNEANYFAKYSTRNRENLKVSKGEELFKNFTSQRSIRSLLRKLKRLKYSFESELEEHSKSSKIIHAHFADMGCELLNFKFLKNKKYVVSFYGWDYEMLPHTNPRMERKYVELFKKVDKLICEGPHGRDILINKGCPKEKIEIVPLGIQCKSHLSIKTISKGIIRFLQVASFREKKGQWHTIQAFKKALEENSNLELTLVGNIDEKDYFQKIEEFISEENLETKVKIKSWIAFEKLNKEMMNFDFFIQPSCYSISMDCEGGAPTTLFNAMQAGLPVISTFHCDIPFVLDDNYNAFLVQEQNVEDLCDAILKAAELDDNSYQQMRNHGFEKLKREFDINKNVKRLEKIYTEL